MDGWPKRMDGWPERGFETLCPLTKGPYIWLGLVEGLWFKSPHEGPAITQTQAGPPPKALTVEELVDISLLGLSLNERLIVQAVRRQREDTLEAAFARALSE